MNAGCGSVQPEGWDNMDVVDYGQHWIVDLLEPHFAPTNAYDYIVANHLLSCFSHHELTQKVLPNLMRMLKPNGVLRVLVPDADLAIRAYCNNDPDWFPLGDDLPGVDERFCTFLPWFGESKSIFTWKYLAKLANDAGYGIVRCGFGKPGWSHVDAEIASLDDRERQALIVEIKNHV